METLDIISVYSILIPFILGLLFLKKLSRDSVIIWGVAAAGIIPQMLRPVLYKTIYLNVAYNLYVGIEFALVTVLLSNKFLAGRTKKLFHLSIFGYFFAGITIIFVNGLKERFLNELICLNSFLYAAWILMLMIEQFDDRTVRIEILPSSSFTWFLTAMFIYALGTIMIFAFWNFVKEGPEKISGLLTGIHAVFNIILYLLMSIGLVIDILGKSRIAAKATQ